MSDYIIIATYDPGKPALIPAHRDSLDDAIILAREIDAADPDVICTEVVEHHWTSARLRPQTT